MDSRLIYESNKIYIHKIDWIKSSCDSKSEWIFLNLKDDNINELITQLTSEYLLTDIVYVSTSRNESFEASLRGLSMQIKSLIGINDFQVWSEGFLKVIDFSKIGVFRKGIRALKLSTMNL